ncbi:OCIA domain-containing protein 1 isoform X2 [Rhipicephalus sanguineus]|uniref:OCIA domain-containing protein 1 isoform X2 n=1 Tax=Rhipicephalus sanguineus TaxID=34632 RepID=UPI0018963B31|nr:OCIA domain-containing protein 1 isoform X2 [Rhipicephalus sanguineus]
MATSSDMLPPSEVAAGGYDQDRRQRLQGHVLTPEEVKAFQECSNESFKYRALPLGLLASFGAQYAIKVGYLAPHPKYGPYLKMFGAGFVGWLVGKISYRRQCEEKLMKLPNSPIGEALRRKYGISSPDAVMGSQSGDYASLSGQDRSGDLGSQSLDLRSYNAPQGLDDSQRPSMDNPVIAEVPENLPPAKYSTTYEELRRRNREEYERRLSAPPPPSQLPPPALSQQPPLAPSQPPSQPFDERTQRSYPTRIPSSTPSGGKKNKYGDTWED